MKRLLFLLAACLIMIFCFDSMEAVKQAAHVFLNNVMPALFPMMVLCNLSEHLPCRKGSLWIETLETVIFSFLSGSPASARRVSILVQKDERFSFFVLPLLGICSVISPLFFVGTLQSRLSPGSGFFLLVCHWISAALTGLICWAGKKPIPIVSCPPVCENDSASLLDTLPKALALAMKNLLSVLGAMMLFGLAASLIRKLLMLLLPPQCQKPELFAFLWALMEIGGGGLAVLDSFAVPPLALLCGLCGFGGLSIWIQCLLFCGTEIRPGKLLMVKALHGALGYGVCFFMMKIFPLQSELSVMAASQNWNPRWLLLAPLMFVPVVPGLIRRFFGKPKTCLPHN